MKSVSYTSKKYRFAFYNLDEKRWFLGNRKPKNICKQTNVKYRISALLYDWIPNDMSDEDQLYFTEHRFCKLMLKHLHKMKITHQRIKRILESDIELGILEKEMMMQETVDIIENSTRQTKIFLDRIAEIEDTHEFLIECLTK